MAADSNTSRPAYAVEVSGASKSFVVGETRIRALRAIDVVIRSGEFVAIVGPSGSGKTTLLSVIGTLERVDEGSCRLEGKETTSLDDKSLSLLRRRRIGFVFQQSNLVSHLTIRDNVALPLLYDCISGARAHAAARAALERVGLHDRSGHRPSQLSGGERQRAALARAIVLRPAIILADEPTGNLDSVNGDLVLQLLQSLSRSGHTILLVTHNDKLASAAERVLTMQDGRIVAEECNNAVEPTTSRGGEGRPATSCTQRAEYRRPAARGGGRALYHDGLGGSAPASPEETGDPRY